MDTAHPTCSGIVRGDLSFAPDYARVSTTDQSLNIQSDALKAAGCEKIFADHGVSGAKTERPGLNKALEHVRKDDDVFVIWKLDRLGRSLSHLLSIIEDLRQRGANFASVEDAFDTSTASGKMIFSVMGVMAEYERNLTRERTMAGLASALARGRKGGRPKQLDEGQVRVAILRRSGPAIALAYAGELTIKEICEQVGCSRSTYYRQVAPRLKAPAAAEPLQLDQSVYVVLSAAATTKTKPEPKPKLSYVCKRQPSAGGVVHAFAGQIGPSNWRRPALCGAKPFSQKIWEISEWAEVSCAKCRRKLS